LDGHYGGEEINNLSQYFGTSFFIWNYGFYFINHKKLKAENKFNKNQTCLRIDECSSASTRARAIKNSAKTA
jgi:hypothetical protein